MKHATNCKFCQRPITVEIDDTYAGLGDPFKILSFATCNRCSDLRVERRRLEYHLRRVCSGLEILKSAKVVIPDKARANLVAITRQYAEMVSRWNNMKGMLWEEAIVDALLQDPHHWGDIIGRLWRMHKDWRQHEAQQPA